MWRHRTLILSGLDFTIEDDSERPIIRFGLGAIKNAGEAALNLILDEREENGRFSTLQDLSDRVDLRRVGKRAIEFMIKGRVFNQWGTVDQFIEAMDRIVSDSGKSHDAAAAGQMSLFGAIGGGSGGGGMQISTELLKSADAVDAIDHKQKLEWEKEALGVHVSEHPLERPLKLLQPRTSATITDIDANWNTKTVRLAGMLSQLRTLTTKKGDPMAFGTLEDLDSKIDLVFFPRTWKQCREKAAIDQVMLVTGKVQAKGADEISIIVDRIETNLQIAADADAQFEEPAPTYNTAPPARQNGNGFGSRTNGNGASKANGNGNGKETNAQSRAETAVSTPPPVPAQNETPATGSPPPPPNFEDDMLPGSVAAPAKTAATPPPEPEPMSQPPAMKVGGNGRSQKQTIVVEVRPVSNWQFVFRESVRLAGQFDGPDALKLCVSGQATFIELPNQNTLICPDLFDRLRMLPGIAKVYKA